MSRAAVDALPPLREIIAAHNLRAEKSLGQNFLLDLNLTDKIARLALGSEKDLSDLHVFEIGPGPGGLTRSLLKFPIKKLTAVEFDPRAVVALQSLKNAVDGRLEILQQDALDLDLAALGEPRRAIVANLPYNIATKLLTNWLAQIRADHIVFSSMTLMFQKEVALRLTAKPGGKDYGRLGILAQWLCDVERVFDLPPSAFTPPPKVTSSVVRFRPRVLTADAPSFQALERVTEAAFGQRRKMIRTSLKDYAAVIDALGLDPQKRAENLTVAEFVAMAKFPLKPALQAFHEIR